MQQTKNVWQQTKNVCTVARLHADRQTERFSTNDRMYIEWNTPLHVRTQKILGKWQNQSAYITDCENACKCDPAACSCKCLAVRLIFTEKQTEVRYSQADWAQDRNSESKWARIRMCPVTQTQFWRITFKICHIVAPIAKIVIKSSRSITGNHNGNRTYWGHTSECRIFSKRVL